MQSEVHSRVPIDGEAFVHETVRMREALRSNQRSSREHETVRMSVNMGGATCEYCGGNRANIGEAIV